MGSWMEKFERKEDEKRQRELNEILEEVIKEYDDYNMITNIDINKKIKKLEKVIEAYKSLIIEAFDFNTKDFEQKQKELSTLKYELMQEKHNKGKDAESWEEYKKEEIDKER